MKRVQFYLIISVFFILFSCGNKEKQTVSSPELRTVFTEDEIKDLNVLVDYFESKIKVDGKDMKSCYKDWVQTIISGGEGEYDIDIFNFEDQKKIYKRIDQNTFNQIWTFNKSRRHGEEGYGKTVGPVRDGKYISFLKEVGKDNPEINKYVSDIIDTNEFGRINSLFLELDKKNKVWKIIGDFSDYNNKLIITIHTLTSIDSFNRKEKWEEK